MVNRVLKAALPWGKMKLENELQFSGPHKNMRQKEKTQVHPNNHRLFHVKLKPLTKRPSVEGYTRS